MKKLIVILFICTSCSLFRNEECKYEFIESDSAAIISGDDSVKIVMSADSIIETDSGSVMVSEEDDIYALIFKINYTVKEYDPSNGLLKLCGIVRNNECSDMFQGIKISIINQNSKELYGTYSDKYGEFKLSTKVNSLSGLTIKFNYLSYVDKVYSIEQLIAL